VPATTSILQESPNISNCCRTTSSQRAHLQSHTANHFTSTMNASSFLQLQTQAAHKARRPSLKPVQSSASVTSSRGADSDSSRRSSSESASSVSTDHARCSRCHRGVSIDGSFPAMMGAVNIGMNSYYCQRCATVVGYRT